MRMLLSIFLAVCVCICCISVKAETDVKIPVALCYNGDAYAVDYVFRVAGNADIRTVQCNFGGMVEWNYIESEARLYISLASAYAFPLTENILSVTATADIALQLESATVNGVRRDDVFSAHTETEISAVPPTCDNEGWTAGKKCAFCGYVLEQPQAIPALKPDVEIVYAADDSITVSGKISDTATAQGRIIIEVLSKEKQILQRKDITDLDQTAFSVLIEDCREAAFVRITCSEFETGDLLNELLYVPVYPLGDANHDGKADSSDAVAILRNLAGYEVANFYEDTADFNGDGKADSSDAVAILRKLAGY